MVRCCNFHMTAFSLQFIVSPSPQVHSLKLELTLKSVDGLMFTILAIKRSPHRKLYEQFELPEI